MPFFPFNKLYIILSFYKVKFVSMGQMYEKKNLSEKKYLKKLGFLIFIFYLCFLKT